MDPPRVRTSFTVSGSTPTEGGPTEASERVADLLVAHVDRLAGLAVSTAAGLDPLLERPDVAGAIAAAKSNLLQLAAALRDRRPPTPEEIEAVAGVAAVRAREGVSREAFARGYSTVLRAVWGELVTIAETEGPTGAALHESLQTLWVWADVMAERAANHFAAYDLERARHDEQARTQFLHQLVDGTVTAADVRTRATAFGLQPGRSHVVLRAVLGENVTLPDLERAVRAALGGRQSLVGLQGDDVVGVLPDVPVLDAELGTIAVGPPRELADLHDSDVVASSLLSAARRFGRTGTVTVADLGLHLLVAGDDVVGRHLEARYLAPVADAKEDLAGTVDSYLRNGLRIDAVAKELFLHPNSVRKRLHRYEELTGVDLAEVDQVVEVWWALRRRDLARHEVR